MDLQMPVIDGPEAIRAIRDIAPDARILVLTRKRPSRAFLAVVSHKMTLDRSHMWPE